MFQAGDHVYIGRGHTGLVKHHAIAVTSEKNGMMDIVEYGVYNNDGSKQLLAGHALDIVKGQGEVRRITVNLKKEHYKKVDASPSDRPPQKVVEAALFLLNNADLLPQYHMTFCNGECVARWCKEGTFSSGQANKLYDQVGNTIKTKVAPVIKSTVTLASSSSSKGSSATKSKGPDKLSSAVLAVSAFVGVRQSNVGSSWTDTKHKLDEAFALYQIADARDDY